MARDVTLQRCQQGGSGLAGRRGGLGSGRELGLTRRQAVDRVSHTPGLGRDADTLTEQPLQGSRHQHGHPRGKHIILMEELRPFWDSPAPGDGDTSTHTTSVPQRTERSEEEEMSEAEGPRGSSAPVSFF